MIKKGLKNKLNLTIVIIIIISSLIFTLIPMNQQISRVKAISIWSQSSKSDFNNGTLNNVTLIGNSPDVELRLIDIDLNEWIEKTPENSPLERGAHALAPIFGTDKILLFGGLRGSNPLLNDTWVYDLSENKWKMKYPPNHPSKRYYHAMASVWGTDKIVLMGGQKNSNIFNDTWIYDFSNNTWTNVTTMNNPGRISQHKIASIYGEKKLVLFGGDTPGKNKTWVYDLTDNEWAFKTPANSPPGRVVHSMASIWGTDKVLLFGGDGGGTPYNDSWVYDLSENNWTQIAYGPPGRFQHDMATIYGRDKVILFGGFNWSVGDSNDTWIFDFSENTWTKIFSKNDPGKRLSHLMSSVWGTDKIVLFSGVKGPLINDTWIFNPFKYEDKGTFTSSPYDIGPNSSFKTISWEANGTINTNIRFQIRTAETESDLNSEDFIGPGGFKISYYIFTPMDIWSRQDGDRWIQYKAYLSTTNYEETPRLKNVTITYNYWPNTTLIKPDNENIINNNYPVFAWNFIDRDSTNQSAFHLIIDDDINFESVDYDCNEQSSPNRSWQFPNGTGYTEITDGIWYWKLKTKDNDGDWGLYSEPWRFTIDTIAPTSKFIYPANNKFYNNIYSIYGEALDSTNGTGLDKIELSIHRKTDNSYYDGMSWIDSETWLSASGTSEWSFNSSSIIWYSGWEYQVKSRAKDRAFNFETPMAGNTFIYDFENVIYSNPLQLPGEIFKEPKVEVGITISDMISGVNASTIEYSISTDEGKTWGSWLEVYGLQNNQSVNVKLNLTFPNGTGNRIKWRASDIAGNGPTESKAYIIKVNTWLQTLIPKVKLWSPPNGSTIPTNSVKLHWLLENTNLIGVTYDLYFNTTPPTKPNITGLSESSYTMDDLIDGETYYWMVIPKVDSEEGICTSGVWSFTIDTKIAFPTVKLLRPENGSILSSTKPTLAWSVEYYGTEALSYNVYLDIQPELITYEEAFNPFFLPPILLEDNQTYYWKVVPKAGTIVGTESETWSFTVRKDYVPHFELELKVEPDGILMEPGSIKMVKAFVINKGELTDNVLLDLEIHQDSDMGGIVNEPNILEIDPGDTANFSIMLTTTQNIEAGEVIITVTATSGAALDHEIDYTVEFKVKVIVYEEEEPEPEESSEWLYFWSILIIVFVIILALIIFFLIRHKKEAKETTLLEKTDTLEPSETPEPIHTQEAIPEDEKEIKEPVETSTAEPILEKPQVAKPETQIPVKPRVDTSLQLTPSTTPKPTLETSPTVGQVPVEQQMSEVEQKPQLPPAKSEKIKEGED